MADKKKCILINKNGADETETLRSEFAALKAQVEAAKKGTEEATTWIDGFIPTTGGDN